MPAVLFRCDAGSGIGLGHIMRCRALASAFHDLGWTSAFAMSQASAAALAEDNPIVVPDGNAGFMAVRNAMIERQAGCLVVDHYGLDAEFEQRATIPGATTIAIDDLADRRHDCDLLVDTNPARAASDYAALTPARTHLLLGARYALLRAEFAGMRHDPEEIASAVPRHVVMAPGGADPGNVSAHLLRIVPRLRVAGLNATLMIGQANPHQASLTEVGRMVGADIAFNPPNPVALMASADIAISGAGTTCLEFSCLGVPTVALVLADNQRAVAKAIHDAGAAWMLDNGGPFDPMRVADTVIAVAADPGARRRMSAAGQALIDGSGAARVAAEAMRLHAARKQEQCL